MARENPLVSCDICQTQIKRSRLKWHKRLKHSPEKIEAEGLKELHETRINCPFCKRPLIRKNLKKHLSKVHGIEEPQKKPKMENRFKTTAERERFFREKLGPDEKYSEDIFDRGKVKQGGAFGLGKNRKH